MSQKVLWYSIVCAIFFLCIGGGLGLGLLGRAISIKCDENKCAYAQGDTGCVDFRRWFGLVLQVFLVPVGVLALGACIVEFSQRVRTSCSRLDPPP